jgi:hypothetical protein
LRWRREGKGGQEKGGVVMIGVGDREERKSLELTCAICYEPHVV